MENLAELPWKQTIDHILFIQFIPRNS